MQRTFSARVKRFELKKKGRENKYPYYRIIIPTVEVEALGGFEKDEIVTVTILKQKKE
jgi:hypothetical protein